MKKKLVASLAAAMVLGVAGTSFAASNPFVDVPAKHWSYDSVTKLAQAGVIDGYGDGTFKGDKTVTRYEMAQMVAKAMGNEGKATAVQKAEIKKLVAEYSDELDKLGVRVSNLEKNQSNLKFTGTTDIRYSTKDFDKAGVASSAGADIRFRLEATAKVDDVTTFGIRFVNNSPQQNASNAFGLPQNKSWSRFGNDGDTGTTVAADRFFLSTKFGQVGTTVGRQKLSVGNTGTIVDSGIGSFDGLKLTTKMGQVDTALSVGRVPTKTGSQIDLQELELSTTSGKLSYGVGYFNVKDSAVAADPELLKLYYGNAKYLFDSKFSINAEAGKNKADYATDYNTFYTVWATAGDQTLSKAGQHNIQARYYRVGAASVGADGGMAYWGTISEGVKFGPNATTFTSDHVTATQLYYNYAFSNNLTGQIGYYIGKSPNYAAGDYKMFRGVLSAKF